MAAVASLTALIILSSRGGVAEDLVVVEAVVPDVVDSATVDTAPVVLGVPVIDVEVGDVAVTFSVVAGVAVREASASEKPEQVGLLSGLVEH